MTNSSKSNKYFIAIIALVIFYFCLCDCKELNKEEVDKSYSFPDENDEGGFHDEHDKYHDEEDEEDYNEEYDGEDEYEHHKDEYDEEEEEEEYDPVSEATSNKCQRGFRKDSDGECVDIDECKDPNMDKICKYGCINTMGSFFCNNEPKYQIDKDEDEEKHSTERNEEEDYGHEEEDYENEDYDEDGSEIEKETGKVTTEENISKESEKKITTQEPTTTSSTTEKSEEVSEESKKSIEDEDDAASKKEEQQIPTTTPANVSSETSPKVEDPIIEKEDEGEGAGEGEDYEEEDSDKTETSTSEDRTLVEKETNKIEEVKPEVKKEDRKVQEQEEDEEDSKTESTTLKSEDDTQSNVETTTVKNEDTTVEHILKSEEKEEEDEDRNEKEDQTLKATQPEGNNETEREKSSEPKSESNNSTEESTSKSIDPEDPDLEILRRKEEEYSHIDNFDHEDDHFHSTSEEPKFEDDDDEEEQEEGEEEDYDGDNEYNIDNIEQSPEFDFEEHLPTSPTPSPDYDNITTKYQDKDNNVQETKTTAEEITKIEKPDSTISEATTTKTIAPNEEDEDEEYEEEIDEDEKVSNCPRGYERSQNNSCVDIDECLDEPCSHFCVNLEGSFRCECPERFSLYENTCRLESCPAGFKISKGECKDINECLNHDCAHFCQNTNGSYECTCEDGYVLDKDNKSCIDINECLRDNICPHQCQNTNGSYLCICDDGFQLSKDNQSCIDIDECQKSNCQHVCNNFPGGYSCDCKSGYKLLEDGSTCEDINECSLNNGNCSQICINTFGSFSCHCKPHFVLNDNSDCTPLDPCIGFGCSHSCKSVEGRAKCDCPYGYQLDGKTCTKINPCDINNGNCSDFCEIIDDEARCLCPQGHKLVNATHCVEIDQCTFANGGCSHHCKFEDHAVICTCPESHELKNKTHCFKRNPCLLDNGGCSHICVFEEDTLKCDCPENFYLEGKTCYRRDPCIVNNGGCSHNCLSNDLGEVSCSCPDHFNLINGTNCEHINECLVNNGGCSQECVSEAGKAYCLCSKGYKLDGKECVKENPCQKKNGGCSHICESVDGQVICKCPPKYELIGTTCFKINPCLTDNGGCSHTCKNDNGIAKCSCPVGFKLKSKTKCEEENLCIDNGGCSHHCQTVDQRRVCSCPKGYILRPNGRTCKELNECLENRGGCSHGCKNIPGSFLCTCPVGFKLSDDAKTCVDINECLVDNGNCQMKCKNFLGTYRCSCDEGYVLNKDKRSCDLITFSDCAALKDPEFGYLKCDHGHNKTFVGLGTKCHVFCHEGYDLAGEAELECRNTGNWDHAMPYCSASYCPKLGKLKDGWFLPSKCSHDYVSPGESCSAYCKKGYKIRRGYEILSCNQDLFWEPRDSIERLSDICIRDITQPYIKCPSSGHLNFILPTGHSHIHVKLPKPETNVDWFSDVRSEPTWGTQLTTILPAGKTLVRFFVATGDNNTTSCTIIINVMDKEEPSVYGCPANMKYTAYRDQTSQLVFWREPRFSDNVGVASVFKSREPGTSFGIGLHKVSYVASDEAGNKAFCEFTVEIEGIRNNLATSAASPNHVHHRDDRYKAVLVCPGGRNPQTAYDNDIPRGTECYWKHMRVDKLPHLQNGKPAQIKVNSGSRLPPHLRTKHRYFQWYDKCC